MAGIDEDDPEECDPTAKLVEQAIRQARHDASLTQAQLARRLETTTPYVTNVEAVDARRSNDISGDGAPADHPVRLRDHRDRPGAVDGCLSGQSEPGAVGGNRLLIVIAAKGSSGEYGRMQVCS